MTAQITLTLLLVSTLQLSFAGDLTGRSDSAQRHQMLAGAERLKTDERIATLEAAVKGNPNDIEIRVALASALVQKLRETGDVNYLSRASVLVDQVLSDQPRSQAAKRLRNEIEMNLHHFPKVADSAQTMLSQDPSDASTLGLLGDAYMELGQYDKAGEAYRRMASLGGNLFSYNRLAYHAFVTGNPEVALGWMAQAIQAGGRSPENEAWCLSEMGDMLFKTGRLPDAAFAYKRSLEIFPGYHRAYAGKGRIDAAAGRTKEAIAAFQRAQSVVPLPEYTGALIALYELAGDKQGASRQQALLSVADRLMSANGERANRNLALIYAGLNINLARALDLTNAEFEVRHDVYSYDALAWALYRNGKLSEAKDASDKALSLHTPEPNFYFHAGMIDLAKNDRSSAKQQLEKAISLNPNFDIRDAQTARSTLAQLN